MGKGLPEDWSCEEPQQEAVGSSGRQERREAEGPRPAGQPRGPGSGPREVQTAQGRGSSSSQKEEGRKPRTCVSTSCGTRRGGGSEQGCDSTAENRASSGSR